MRKIFSAIAIILGLAALVVGIGQRTIWAPPETLTASFSQPPAPAPVTLIQAGVGAVNGQPSTISIKGEGEFSASLIRSSDAQAWVGKAAHTNITGVNATDQVLDAQAVTGEESVPNPVGGDIFEATEKADQEMTYHWTNPDNGSWTLLLAADGKAAAPTDISVTWAGDTATPYSMPLMIIGALLLIAGLAAAAVRPRGGSGTGRRAAGRAPGTDTGSLPQVAEPKNPGTLKKSVATLGVLAMVALPSGPAFAAASETPASPAASDSPGETPQVFPVVLQTQLERILEATANSVTAADKSTKEADLADRTAGALKVLRSENYKLRADGVKLDGPLGIDTSVIRSAAVPAQENAEFPRSIMVVTAKDTEATTIPMALTLTQENPRDNYKLVFATPMLPGSTFPGIAVGDPDVQMSKADASGLSVAPKEALSRLAGVMDDAKSKNSDDFTKSAFLTLSAKGQTDLVSKNKDAKITFKRTVNEKDTVVLSVPGGGALVSGNFTAVTTAKPKETGGTIGLDDVTAKITGEKETTKGIEISYGEPMLIFIPAADSKDKISVVAAEVITKGAKLLK
ncbi:hypothetical protein CQ018_19075 [Arthrobacter sp. MYb227]|uniref:hypothetical protein n=1 Tax=Arthrobacter sp. MYb227 TaxID=1848601 RepID=UPI000CFAA5C1|nr:hypothetical protein [Arthrobacter sp. MYb227]PQZ86165.1 hypothetical protein CQ018_19075 [Arthrobacter sp. MYb227]